MVINNLNVNQVECFVCRATTCEKIWAYNCETKQYFF